MIRVRGARVHNLQSIDLDLPLQQMVLLVGPSGSGKSSLLFDLLHREGLRRFVEAQGGSLSRWFGVESSADVDSIEGLPPTLALRPQSGTASLRSSVGSLSEIAPLLRRLFAQLGKMHCPSCGLELRAWSVAEAATDALLKAPGKRVRLLVSAARMGLKEEHWRQQAQAAGFVRVRWGGEDRDLSHWSSDHPLPADAMVVVDRLVLKEEQLSRLRDSLATLFQLGKGVAVVEIEEGDQLLYTSLARCPLHSGGVAKLRPSIFSSNHPEGACAECGGAGRVEVSKKELEPESCRSCGGDGLSPQSDLVQLWGRTFRSVWNSPVEEVDGWLGELSLSGADGELAERPVAILRERLQLLMALGLGHLQLGRRGTALSGGELLRVRLAAQLGTKVSGILIAAEEPLAGLHSHDAERVWGQLVALRERGNSLIVVEHQPLAINGADHIVELGPTGGKQGGVLLYNGPTAGWSEAAESVTYPYMGKTLQVPSLSTSTKRRVVKLLGASGRNLCNLDFEFALGEITVISGLSGSGKSTLLIDTLAPALLDALSPRLQPRAALPYRAITGAGQLGAVRLLRQGRLSGARSTVATALGVWDVIRSQLAQTAEARLRGWSAGRFSLNIKGGRCENCSGTGQLFLDPEALPDLWVECPVCGGERFESSTLEIELKGKNSSELLQMQVDDAASLFRQWPAISSLLAALDDVGLGYLTLGQSVETLSCGEGQRLRLAAELGKPRSLRSPSGGKPAVYLLDEPARGLHPSEVERLLRIFRKLADNGNAVVLVEHRQELLAAADQIWELGPGGGSRGGCWVSRYSSSS